MSSLPFIVAVASCTSLSIWVVLQRSILSFLPFVAIFAMSAALFSSTALWQPCRCRFYRCKSTSLRGVADFSIPLASFFNALIFLFVFCLFTRSAQRLVFSFRHGSSFRLSAAKLTVHVFHEKNFRKYEKNFQKIDKILKTILTLPFCQSIIMVEKYIRKTTGARKVQKNSQDGDAAHICVGKRASASVLCKEV